METGSLEELAARRRRAVGKTRIIRSVSDDVQLTADVGELRERLDALKQKLEAHRERKRAIRSQGADRRKGKRSFDDIYVEFMFHASALCLILYVSMHVFRLIVMVTFPYVLMDCAIIVDNETEILGISSFSIARKLLMGTLPCDLVLGEECGFHANGTCPDGLELVAPSMSESDI